MVIRRRRNDFGGTGQTVVLFSACTCCCCCCLHWAGAVIGGAGGVLVACRSKTERQGPRVHPLAKRSIAVGMVLGVVATALLVALGVQAAEGDWWGRLVAEALAIALVFVPSLAVLPVGAVTLLAVMAVRPYVRRAPRADDQPAYCDGVQLVWRVAWKAFFAATLLSGLGYLVMLVDALLGGFLVSALVRLFNG